MTSAGDTGTVTSTRTMTTTPTPGGGWTSTTAPGKRFGSRAELSLHYKSDWHRYNLKRKEAGLAPVTEDQFRARLEAVVALRREQAREKELNGKAHLKKKQTKQKKEKKTNSVKPNQQRGDSRQQNDEKSDNHDKVVLDDINSDTIIGTDNRRTIIEKDNSGTMDVTLEKSSNNDDDDMNPEDKEEDTVHTIDPLHSLFDRHQFRTVQENMAYMLRRYGFFVPDQEHLIDAEGLVGYCAEKIWMGHICLYCQKVFPSGSATLRHMISKQHCKLRYEEGVDLDEFEVFYDFDQANEEFLDHHYGTGGKMKKHIKKEVYPENDDDVVMIHEGSDDDEDDEWEDMDDDDDDVYERYTDALNNHGFGVTELGELILPSGKVIGHRTLSKYYNQRFAPVDPSLAVARTAVLNDRYDGHYGYAGGTHTDVTAKALSGLPQPSGRALQQQLYRQHNACGKGILVPKGGGGGTGFSAVSLYRYRAAVKKSRRGDAAGHRAFMKYKNNGNKFDKKGNRLVTNVSVAHALR